MQERVNITVDSRYAVQMRLSSFNGTDLARRELLGQARGGKLDQLAHCSSPRIALTLKRLPSCSGAPAKACAVVNVGPATSGLNTLTSGIG